MLQFSREISNKDDRGFINMRCISHSSGDIICIPSNVKGGNSDKFPIILILVFKLGHYPKIIDN